MAMATFVLLFILLASPAALAKDHIVGGDGGWSQSGDYTTWAGGETFTVGDNLVFNYGGSHGVAEVSKDDYDSCNAANALQSFSDGKTTIKLSKAGPMYFMCPTFGHCQTARRLKVSCEKSSKSVKSWMLKQRPKYNFVAATALSITEKGVILQKMKKECERKIRAN
nr:uclacyanin-3-like [Ipomoea batatas]